MTITKKYLKNKKGLSPSQIAWKRFKQHKLAMISLYIILFLGFLSVVVPILSSYDVRQSNIKAIFHEPSLEHFLGTDDKGYDVFTRLFYGGRISLTVGILSSLTAAIIGTLIGAIAAYFGGLIDSLLMRFTDTMLSLPVLPFLIILATFDFSLETCEIPKQLNKKQFETNVLKKISNEKDKKYLLHYYVKSNNNYKLRRFLGSSETKKMANIFKSANYNISCHKSSLAFLSEKEWGQIGLIIIIIALFSWMSVARLVRGEVLSLKQREFIDASRAAGSSHWRIISKHLIPNALTPVIISITLSLGAVIQYEAVLSFLGLGIPVSTPSWGNMLSNAQEFFIKAPNLAIYPGVFIAVTIVCINFIGDGLRDALDPRQILSSKR